ncbi:MAG: SDR family oxidoreductase [Candidatus Omnitrophica bacterium]|nr:SDR family oxidoreductase [Candidatus Omnitrophota bacterium]
MRFLVTGGAGFIGSHIVEKLLKEGHFVRVLDNFATGKEENLAFVSELGVHSSQFELIKGDICDYFTCFNSCKGIDYVLHQAALKSVPKSMSQPHEYNETNIDGTVNLLRAARANKVKRFVFASSSSVYGTVDVFPQKEEHLPKLISPYALTKLAGEYYCRVFSENFGLETVSLRYFNVFGPRQAPDDEYAAVIPKFIQCLITGEQPPIFGDGKQSRDFTHVYNVVEANILAATTPGIKCEVLNVALGKDSSILELVDLLNAAIGKTIAPKFLPPRVGDVKRSLADTSRIKEVLNYVSRLDFKQGLENTVDWSLVVYSLQVKG